MTLYKSYDLNQAKMIPLVYADQVLAGSFQHALNDIIERHLDLSLFDERYANDATANWDALHGPKYLRSGRYFAQGTPVIADDAAQQAVEPDKRL